MKFYSTNKKSEPVDFKTATLNGQPPDKGLYFPTEIPILSQNALTNLLRDKSKAETAFTLIRPFVGETIPDETLYQICEETIAFKFPLVKITENIFALELFHGPTLAFKDVGARFMSRCLSYFSREQNNKVTVLVATSGDTGGAVASSFFGVENVEVVIMYPSGKVSQIQELQLTTLGGNVTALEINGTFDDCQDLAKRALADQEINQKVFLTSANSINVARWLPQQFYYFFALQQWQFETPPVICVPSGNFGNIGAGLLAHASGLPATKFIAACNQNDVVPRFFASQNYAPKASIATLSNAMDVNNPSNFVRILELFKHDFVSLSDKLSAVSVSDEETAATMQTVFARDKYVLGPHSAVAFHSLSNYLADKPDLKGILLATAHPIKFDSVKEIIGTQGNVPSSIEQLLWRSKQSVKMNVNYEDLKSFLSSKS